MRHLTALFSSMDAAQLAVERIVDTGIEPERISLVAKDPREDYREEVRHKVTGFHKSGDVTGAAAGGIMGGMWGAAIGFLAGAVVLGVPGLGQVFGIGPLLAAFGGAGIGAMAGGSIGALTDLGMSEEAAERYFEGVAQGHILLGVSLEESDGVRLHRVRELLVEGGATSISDHDLDTIPAERPSAATVSAR
jgi:hypothetical protein